MSNRHWVVVVLALSAMCRADAAPSLCCDADSAEGGEPVTTTLAKSAAADTTAAPPAVTPSSPAAASNGAVAPAEDGNGLDAPVSAPRRNPHWQSFLPGIIK